MIAEDSISQRRRAWKRHVNGPNASIQEPDDSFRRIEMQHSVPHQTRDIQKNDDALQRTRAVKQLSPSAGTWLKRNPHISQSCFEHDVGSFRARVYLYFKEKSQETCIYEASFEIQPSFKTIISKVSSQSHELSCRWEIDQIANVTVNQLKSSLRTPQSRTMTAPPKMLV